MTSRPDRSNRPTVETLLLHADRELNTTSSVVPPIYQTATFYASSPEDFLERSSTPRHPEFYTRYGNPTVAQVEKVLASLEGTEDAMLTASGMGAISVAVLSLVGQGKHVVAQTSHYGATINLIRDMLPRFGVAVTQVDQRDTNAFEKAMRPETALVLLESPSNPSMWLTDIKAVAAIAKAHGAITLIDNTFATPINQRPIDLGIDLVAHSATKYFGGHSDLIAGVVLGSSGLIEKIWNNHVVLGAAPSPFDAWLILRGLRTLSLRVQKHNENAMKLAEFLEHHRGVKAVNYPGLRSHPQHELARKQMRGFGGMLSVEVHGGYEGANRVLNKLHWPRLATSLGGVESLVVNAMANFVHYMTVEEAEQRGIPTGLIRVSVGLEGAADLIADFDQALS